MKKVTISILILFIILLIFFWLVYNRNNMYQSDNILQLESREDSINTDYKIGDIILADGSIVKLKDFTVIDNNNLPVAVIVGLKDSDSFLGLGIYRSDECLQWIPDENNYSAFDFIKTYAETYKITGEYASDWYMPNIEELNMIYKNRETINISLQKIYELDNNAAMNGLGTNWYWSSSQSNSKDDYAWFVHFVNGYAGECPKNFTNLHVLAVRIF